MSTYDVVVVGGGQAGLATAYWCRSRGSRAVVLDAGAATGDSWRHRWDSLRLFTPASVSRLPGAPLLARDPAHPTKDEVADHLAVFANCHALDVRPGVHVDRVDGAEDPAGELTVRSGDLRWTTRSVVAATGAHHRSRLPAFAADLTVPAVHAVDYRRPTDVPGDTVLVVGAANSGAEIALDLAHAGRRVLLSGRDVGHLPALGATTFRLMRALGRGGAALSRRGLAGRGDPLGRIRPGDLERAGVVRLPVARAATGAAVVLADGTETRPDAVVWATGHDADLGWLADAGVLDRDGRPVHRSGLAVADRRVGFVGLPYQRSIASHLLCGVSADAAYVVNHLPRVPRRGRSVPAPA